MCIVFSSVYVFSYFCLYTSFIFDGCGELRIFLYLSGIRILSSMALISYAFCLLHTNMYFVLNGCDEFGFFAC